MFCNSDNQLFTQIVKGADWVANIKEWQDNGITKVLADYSFIVQFKDREDAQTPSAIQPKVEQSTNGLRLSLTETDTAKIKTGVVWINIFATKDGHTQRILTGYIKADYGLAGLPPQSSESAAAVNGSIIKTNSNGHGTTEAIPATEADLIKQQLNELQERFPVKDINVVGTEDLRASYILKRGN